jgi:uncharacterized membrane protein YebE (DUF533 family)
MSIQSLLNQLLQAANNGPGRTDVGKYATGAAAGGVLGLLLGSRRGRGIGGSALKYGSVAALGALAWSAYRDWEAKQKATAATPAAAPQPPAPQFAQLPAPQQEDHAWAMLRAMIAAAKSDGHLDDRERGLLEAELQRVEADPALRSRVETELRRPVEPAEVAAGIGDPAQAAEVYLASLVVCDSTTTMERAYLDALASALKLPPELKADLEARVAVEG